MKKFILPVVVFLTGAGGAFASTVSKTADSTMVPGHRFDPSASEVKCIEVAQCSTIEGAECTWNSEVLREKINDTACGAPLYRVN